MLPDYHMHTPLCRHAHGEPEEYAAEAVRKGLTEICFTDHSPAPEGLEQYGMRLDEFPAYQEAVFRCRESAAIPVLFGIELNMSGLIRSCNEIYPSPLILNLARERGIPISFGSDAHGPQDVGRYFDQALKLAKDAGYTHCLRMRGRKKELVPLPGG
jgi:histidinol phosphatase-like PHP family hydrolase